MICGKRVKCVPATLGFEKEYGEVALHVFCGHDVAVIRVVTYGRFDFTDDLRSPRSDASPRRATAEKETLVAAFLYRKVYS